MVKQLHSTRAGIDEKLAKGNEGFSIFAGAEGIICLLLSFILFY